MFFEIASVEDMNIFSRYVNNGKTNKACVGWTFKVVVGELDYTGKEYVRIKDVFSGTFDGQGVEFKNLTYASLFSTIKDGTVMNITIGASCTLNGDNNVGGIATNNEGGYIIGCTNNADAKGNFGPSGIVRNVSKGGVVRDCVNNGTIRGGDRYAAGIAGNNDGGTIENCINNGTIDSYGYCGGIVGWNEGTGVVSNCTNTGAVKGRQQDVGGIAGDNGENSIIQDCTNTGTVECNSYQVGGIVGNSGGTIMRCTNSGDVTSGDTTAGGIAGTNGGETRECRNTGNVTAESGSGGIAGGSRGSIYDCEVSSCTISVKKSLYAGAILGASTHGILSENYYSKDVTVVVSTGSNPRTFEGETPRGRGASGVGGKNDPEDVYEMTEGGVKYYNGAVLEGSTGISAIAKDMENADIYTLDGKRVANVQRGVNIIRANGAVRKVTVK